MVNPSFLVLTVSTNAKRNKYAEPSDNIAIQDFFCLSLI